MLSESARSTTAAEMRFRVQAPNSTPRSMLVVALDAATATLGYLLAQDRWQNAKFANFQLIGSQKNPAFLKLEALDKRDFDVVVLVGTAGCDLADASGIAARYSTGGAKIAALLLAPAEAGRSAVASSLSTLRPLARTLALVRDGEFFRDLLLALGA